MKFKLQKFILGPFTHCTIIPPSKRLLLLLLLKSVEFDDDVVLLLSVASLVMGPHVTSESEIGSTDSAALRTSRACLRLCGNCVTSCTSFFRGSDPAIYKAPETGITDTHTHTPVLRPFFRDYPGRAGTRKVKPIWTLLKQETVSGSGIRWAICKSAPRSRQIATPAPHHSVFYRPDALPAAQPTASKH